MFSISDLKKGTTFVLDGEPYLVLEASHSKMAQRRAVLQTKIRNLISGKVISRNFAQSETVAEAEIERKSLKFIYKHRDKFVFCEPENPAKRIELDNNTIDEQAGKFLKNNMDVEAFVFNEKIISISLPIKMEYIVKDTPPGVRGNTAQGGTKTAILENGTEIQVPLFVNPGDKVRVNTELGTYTERAND